jgi:hypothetical protein
MLVFLERTRDGRLRTTGMALGAYRVGTDGMVRREIPRPDSRPLDAFLGRLRALAGHEPVREESDGRVARRRDEVVQRMVTERFTLLGNPPGRWTTPHMFVIDKKGTVVYEGAIDDDPSGDNTGKATNYVEAALEDVTAGKPVRTAETKSYGCGVKYKR